jgi:hypothetical protein
MGAAAGGFTAIATSERERDIRDPFYLGALVISDLEGPSALVNRPQAQSSSTYFASLAYGAKTGYPEFQLRDVFTEKGLKLYQAIQQSCSDLDAVQEIPVADAMKPEWSRNKFIQNYLARSIPGRTNAYGPILLISSAGGHSGQAVSEAVGRMCKVGDQIQWEQYPEPDPARVIGDSVRQQIGFIEGRLAGRSFSRSCQ